MYGQTRDDVASKMADFLIQSKADNTIKKNGSVFSQFQTFCDSNGFTSKPARSIHVAMYLTDLIDQGKSNHVISSAVYGIKWVHNINDLPDPTESNIVKSLMEAAKRLNSKPVQKKDNVTSEMLQALCATYEHTTYIIDLKDVCMIMLAFAGFFRFNEISNLHCNDLTFNSDHIIVRVRSSKTDVYRHGNEVFIAKGRSCACPYALLQRYILAAEISMKSDEFLFKPAFRSKSKASLIKKNKSLSYTRANECIVKKLKLVAPDMKLGTHTLRASGATAAANTPGVSDRCLKRHGRWKSDLAKDGYIDDSKDKKLFITKVLNL